MNAQVSYHYINLSGDFTPKVEVGKDETVEIHFPDTKDKSLVLSLSLKNAGTLSRFIEWALQDYDLVKK